LRKTQKAEWYVKTNGQMEQFAVGHTPEIAASHYADIPALRHVHEQTVVDGLQDALDAALEPRLIRPEEEEAIRAMPALSDLPVMPEEVVAFLDEARTRGWRAVSAFTTARSGPRAKRVRSRSGGASSVAMR
jgi:hypothetical protein